MAGGRTPPILEAKTLEVNLAGLDKLLRENEKLKKAAEDLLKAYDMLLPGIKHIAVQDYALINMAPFNMRRLIEE